MNRRDALSLLSAAIAGSLGGASLFWTGCRRPEPGQGYVFFSPQEVELLDQIGETILPATPGLPGAKEVQIGAFMDGFVADCFEPEDQTVLREGLVELDRRCMEAYGKGFSDLSPEQQHDTLLDLDMEAETYLEQMQPLQPPHFFSLLKGLTLLGYFTSEPGATQALRYVPVPGKFDGEINYQKGEKAWAI